MERTLPKWKFLMEIFLFFFVNGKRPMCVVVSESDMPGSSLNGRNPSELKNDELRFWLKCRDDPAKGLRVKR